VKRRRFLKASAAGGALAFVNPVSSFSEPKATGVPDPAPAFEFEEMLLSEMQQALQSGRFSSRSLVEKYVERINDVDKRGPALNSVIELNPDAEAIAAALDRERKEKGPRGPLHGIPILIKDNIDSADLMKTTAGSLALLSSRPKQDASVARRMREAGAILLGKTNLSDWANIRSSKSSSGWSARGGQTKNPYALDRNPCGSSSGSGVAPSANLCAAAIGTETDGSVVCPSSANSLVGIKPTVGLVSRAGIIPIAHSQDTAGPMTRTVADAAIILGALAGEDPRDPKTKESRGHVHSDYTRFLDRNGLAGARLGIVRKNFGFNDRVDRLMNDHIATMKRLGAVVIDPVAIPTAGKFDDSELEVLLYELKADLNAYLSGLGPQAPVKSLRDVIEFNEKNRDREMPYFGQDLFIKAQEKGPLTSKPYIQALRRNQLMSRSQGIDFVLKQHRLDALIAPTGGPAWPTDLANGDHFTGGYSTASAVSGYPHITVPAGYIFGLPVGISFFAGAYSEPKLITIAYAFEQATKARRPPKFLPTADLSL
jgi:amidase